jgi:hypothetical protein
LEIPASKGGGIVGPEMSFAYRQVDQLSSGLVNLGIGVFFWGSTLFFFGAFLSRITGAI